MPQWANSGREIFFLQPEDRMIIAAQVEVTPTFRVVDRQELFVLGREFASAAGGGNYSVASNDQRFLMMRNVTEEAEGDEEMPRYILVYNWFEELKAKVGN